MSKLGKPVSQRQLRVGEMLKQSLSMIFLREETKISDLDTKSITVTEVRMSPDLKAAKVFVIPLGGKGTEKVIDKLKEFSFVIRKVLSKKIMVKFMPKLFFVNDDSFDYAEKIENLIRQTKNKNNGEKNERSSKTR